jgi:iron complex transport system substrate-binding protein
VDAALAVLGAHAEVLSLDPHTLDDVVDCIATVAAATGTDALGAQLTHDLRERVEAVRAAVAGRPRPRVLTLEWRDPPFAGGHWVPDMVLAAGGTPLLGDVGKVSRRVTWEEIGPARPEVVVFMPCGYDLATTMAHAAGLSARVELQGARCYSVDASAYFSRPSPRIVDGLEVLAWIIHPDAVPEPPPDRVAPLG